MSLDESEHVGFALAGGMDIALRATPTVPLERRLSPPKKTGRRDFLLMLGSGIVATASGITACNGEGIAGPPVDEPLPDVIINGDSNVQINHWGGYATAQFDSNGSSPGTVNWSYRRDNPGLGNSPVGLGHGTSVAVDLTIPGDYTVTCVVDDGDSTGRGPRKPHPPSGC